MKEIIVNSYEILKEFNISKNFCLCIKMTEEMIPDKIIVSIVSNRLIINFNYIGFSKKMDEIRHEDIIFLSDQEKISCVSFPCEKFKESFRRTIDLLSDHSRLRNKDSNKDHLKLIVSLLSKYENLIFCPAQ